MSNSPQEQKPLYISRLDVKLSERSRKEVESVKLHIRNNLMKNFQATISPGNSHKQTFIPALVLQPGDPLYVSVQCRTPYRRRKVKIAMNYHEISSGAEPKGGIRKYEKTAKKIDAIISLHLLRPTTDDILEICPWFRVLIIGNSGVGKTSLIKKVFGINKIDGANDERGTADIDKEFVSSQNGRFIFHDSDGFEEGQIENVEVVERFVKGHSETRIKDQLHAVWLCLEVPYSGGRLLQSGVEGFLQRRREILGDVPLVIVLTKVDLLDNQLRTDVMMDNSEGETFEQRKSEFLEKYCFGPLRKVAGDAPHVIVSTNPEYSTTHHDVIKATQERVTTNVGEDPSVVIAMAQRASVKVNFETSIAIGRKKYWSRLAQSTFLSGYTLRECVKVLHQDIVAVWNFDDPNGVLQQDSFIDALFRMGELDQLKSTSPPVGILQALGTAKEIVGACGEPILTTVLTVAEAVVLATRLAYETHQQFARVIKLLMLYIIGSMFVMQIIFLLSPEGRVTSQVVEHAIYTYLLSKKQEVRQHIEGFDVERGLYPGGPDHILNQVECLIRSFSLSDDEIKDLRQAMQQQHPEAA